MCGLLHCGASMSIVDCTSLGPPKVMMSPSCSLTASPSSSLLPCTYLHQGQIALTIIIALLMGEDLQQLSSMRGLQHPLVTKGYCPICMIEGAIVGLTFH